MGGREFLTRALRRRMAPTEPKLSFESWETFPPGDPRVVQVCHPDWRGVRSATYAFRSPVVECADLERWGPDLVDGFRLAGVELVVIQGWPPGAAAFSEDAHASGIAVKCVLHSSPAQHGAEPGEAAVADEVMSLAHSGVLAGVGVVKYGVAEALRTTGHPVSYVPNRAPLLPPVAKQDLGPGLHIGVFAEPFWRKNVVTQLLALSMLDQSVGHVMRKPPVAYVEGIDLVEHGELPWDQFVVVEGSVDLNLYVTLTECHPLMPIESYLLGVPCLISRTSAVFREDPELWELTTVDRLDEPLAIAEAARALLEGRDEAMTRARDWIAKADVEAEATWGDFVSPS